MKLAFFGYDFSFSTLQRLMSDGHKIVKVFSFPVDNMFMFNAHLNALCEQHKIPFQTEKVSANDIDDLIAQGCGGIVSAGYLYKIPPLDDSKICGINIHPTYLPHGRGMMPLPKIILEHPEHAGVTVHKLVADYDMGDILLQEKIDMMVDEDIETLAAKISMRMPDMASQVMNDLDKFWNTAKPQNEKEGSWWGPYSQNDMTIDFTMNADDVNARARAFGRFGMLADIQDQRFAVFNMKAWAEDHNHNAGDVVCIQSREIVIALRDGYVMFKEFQKIEG